MGAASDRARRIAQEIERRTACEHYRLVLNEKHEPLITGSKIGGGMFASALAALGSYASGNVSTQNTYSGGQLAMQGALANLMQTASTLFKKGMDKQNTVTIAPGQQFNIFVTKPVSFGY